MNNVTAAWYIYRYSFAMTYRSKFILVSLILMILLTVFTSTSESGNDITLFGRGIVIAIEDYENSMQKLFFEYFQIFWWIICTGFVPFNIISPVINSYSVSNQLWLRFTPVTSLALDIYRIMIVIMPTLFFGVISVAWVMLFSFIHDVPFSQIIYPIYSLIAFIIFTGGIALWLSGRPTLPIEIRYIYVLFALLVPIIFFLLKDRLIYRVNGIYPFVFPYSSHDIGFETLRPTLATIGLGIISIILFVVINYFKHIVLKINAK